MKITAQQLRRIIKEEVQKVLKESGERRVTIMSSRFPEFGEMSGVIEMTGDGEVFVPDEQHHDVILRTIPGVEPLEGLYMNYLGAVEV